MMKTDLTKYDELIKAALNAKLTTEDNTYSHVINSKLYNDKLLVWLNEPAETILNIDLKNEVEQIIAPLLFPKFVVKFQPGLNIVERPNEPAESARALIYHLHYGRYSRLIVNNLTTDTYLFNSNAGLSIELMKDYFWFPRKSPHLAIQAVTQSGKTSFLTFLLPNLKGFSKLAIKGGAVDDKANSLVVIDPKIDPKLRSLSLKLKADYICPSYSNSDLSFVDEVNNKLGQMMDLIKSRAEILKKKANAKFKDVWLIIDEGLAIPEMTNTKGRNVYFSLLDRLLLMSASTQVHVILTGQAFNAGQIVSSFARLQFSTRILMTPKVTVENAQYLFKSLDKESINNLIIDEDEYGSLGVGIVTTGDGQIVPFKAPFIRGI